MYLNFTPAYLNTERSLTVDAQDGYAVEDLEGFVQSVIDGCTSSLYIATDGWDGDLASHIAALEDGALLADWFGGSDSEDETEEQRAQREAVEEVREELIRYRDQRGLTITLTNVRDHLGSWADESDYAEFEELALAKLRAEWPYATVQLGESHRLVTADHEELRIKERVEAEGTQLLEKVW